MSDHSIDNDARELRRAYYREWRKKNPEKVREWSRRYWQRKAEKLREKQEDQEDE